jgi:exosome complex RNA-binding protein Rrp42 (RNase PH superfamily)
MEAAISSGEKSYLVLGVEQGLRHDGRGVLDFRGFSIRGGVLPQCNGSARISVEGGKTTILAAVKVEVGEPKPSRPAEGWVETHVDCSSSLFARSDDPSRSGVAAKLGQLLQRTLGEVSGRTTHPLVSPCLLHEPFL